MTNLKRNDELATRNAGIAAKHSPVLTVGALEFALLRDFPAQDAESWDMTGLVVGDPGRTVEGVAVALDSTPAAVKEARRVGANVLVTHHPPFISAPKRIMPSSRHAGIAGALVWHAVASDVAVMCYHTALDASPKAANMLPSMLGLRFERVLSPIDAAGERGFGQVCSVADADRPLTVGHLSARCTSVFGRQPRVWGDMSEVVFRPATFSGSAGDFVSDVVSSGIDCLICGEMKYHDALALLDAGVAVIELGHDTSELPYVAPLMSAVERAGVPRDLITGIDQSGNWAYPEATRI